MGAANGAKRPMRGRPPSRRVAAGVRTGRRGGRPTSEEERLVRTRGCPMITADAAFTVARPPEAVFAFLADARNEPTWLPGAADVEKTTAGDVGLGTRFAGR